MLIQDVEGKTGLDRATIRFYEKEEIVVPARKENGYRTYSDMDVELLLKIKLLRQVGLSLATIKGLQQGSGDFNEVISEQIVRLEQRMQEDTRAKYVCCEIKNDGAQYVTLDSAKYLNMLSAPQQPITQSFKEPTAHEPHPWRRYFARYLDYQITSAFFSVLFIVILRIRPFPTNYLDILGYVSNFIAVPILATMLHYFGTTPGKWVMGIRLESIQGGKLSGGEALYREGKIVLYGLGLFIPLLNVWRMYRSYQREIKGEPQVWNEDTEIIYVQWTGIKKMLAAMICIVSFSTIVFAGLDAIMPTYRGDGISLPEFSKNHRDYEKTMGGESEYILGDDGKWKARIPNDTLYFVFDDPNDVIRPEFQYEFDEKGNIQTIFYKNCWKSVDFQRVLPFHCEAAIYTAIGSKPGSNFWDYKQIADHLETDLYRKLSKQIKEGEGSFTVNDVTISWVTQLENCEFVENGIMFAVDEEEMSFTLELEIKFI